MIQQVEDEVVVVDNPEDELLGVDLVEDGFLMLDVAHGQSRCKGCPC